MSADPGDVSQELEQVGARIEAVEEQIEALRAERAEIDDAVDGLEAVSTGRTVQVPLGGGAYLRATIEDIDEVVVDLGGGYAAEQTRDEALDTLETKRDAVEDTIGELSGERAELEEERERLERRAQQLQQQQMQQLQQQMGGAGLGEGE